MKGTELVKYDAAFTEQQRKSITQRCREYVQQMNRIKGYMDLLRRMK